MRLCDINLTVLLPVYNRGFLTANFIEHLVSLLGKDFPLTIVLLDDNSTDHTIYCAKQVFPASIVVQMGGNSYWGGGINAAVHFVMTCPDFGHPSTYFMLANDDIRFLSLNAFMAAFDTLQVYPIVAARGLLVSSLDCSLSHEDVIQSVSGFCGTHYDSRLGNFRDAQDHHEVNVSSTWALIASRQVWLESPVLPHSIPHYLSDYWLTYHWTKNGYSIAHPREFVCLVSSSSTRNVECLESISGFRERTTWFARRLTEVTSPAYTPAWLSFWSQQPVSFFVRRLIFLRRIKYFLARIWLCLFSRQIGCFW